MVGMVRGGGGIRGGRRRRRWGLRLRVWVRRMEWDVSVRGGNGLGQAGRRLLFGLGIWIQFQPHLLIHSHFHTSINFTLHLSIPTHQLTNITAVKQ